MLHTTLHNEAEIIHRRYHKSYFKEEIRIRNSSKGNKINSEQYYDQNEIETSQTGRKASDIITPNLSDDLTLWPKAGNFVVSTKIRSSYALLSSFTDLF